MSSRKHVACCSVRTRYSSGVLLVLRSRHDGDWLSVQLSAGRPCVGVGLGGRVLQPLCATARVNTGRWEHITAVR